MKKESKTFSSHTLLVDYTCGKSFRTAEPYGIRNNQPDQYRIDHKEARRLLDSFVKKEDSSLFKEYGPS